MKMVKEKRKILENWANSQSAAAMGPALSDYIRITSEGAYGSFKIVIGDRKKYWVDAKVSADFLKNVFKRCSATMDAWFSCI